MKNQLILWLSLTLLLLACNSNSSSDDSQDSKAQAANTSQNVTPAPVEQPNGGQAVKKPENPVKEYYGMYTYMADSNTFRTCDKKIKMSIQMKGEYLTLEKRYLKAVDGGTKVFIRFKGMIKEVAAMEGDGKEKSMLITEFLELDKIKNCE